MDGYREYAPAERPEVVFEVPRGDGTIDWFDGELHAWQWTDDGWTASVSWTEGPGMRRLGTVPAGRVHELRYCPWFRGVKACLHGCEAAPSPS